MFVNVCFYGVDFFFTILRVVLWGFVGLVGFVAVGVRFGCIIKVFFFGAVSDQFIVQ